MFNGTRAVIITSREACARGRAHALAESIGACTGAGQLKPASLQELHAVAAATG